MSGDRRTAPGAIVPQGMGSHLSPEAIPYEEALRRNLAMRAEWAARPEEIEKRRQDAEGLERVASRKAGCEGEGRGAHRPAGPAQGQDADEAVTARTRTNVSSQTGGGKKSGLNGRKAE